MQMSARKAVKPDFLAHGSHGSPLLGGRLLVRNRLCVTGVAQRVGKRHLDDASEL